MESSTAWNRHQQVINNVVNMFNANRDRDKTDCNFLSAFWDTCPSVIGSKQKDISFIVLIRSIINDRNQAALNGNSINVPFSHKDPIIITRELNQLATSMKRVCKTALHNKRHTANLFIGGLCVPLFFVNPILLVLASSSIAVINTRSFVNWLYGKSELHQFCRSYFNGFQVHYWLQSVGFIITPKAVKNYEMQTQFSFFNECKQAHLVKLGTQKILGYTVKVFNVFYLTDLGINSHYLCFSVDLKSNTFGKPTPETFSVETINADISMFPKEAAYDSYGSLLPTPTLDDNDGHEYRGCCSDFVSFSDKNTFTLLNTLQSHQPNYPFFIQKTETSLYFAVSIGMLNLANFNDDFDNNKFNLISSNEPVNSTLINLIRLCSKSKTLMEI
ncbi:hypothetical protein C9J21_19965 [Photobacterium phosphoreum]|uniref:hypothetical protein n=1 Tax=Photobacterium phosphoreum TaxID=659 RepID=UPI000D160C80|nr:hypothetical protein [Photobacterium phosphoreum]PSW29165.1 hypothetical protein C9J21_19965 [Photobacterium phosphoreum]